MKSAAAVAFLSLLSVSVYAQTTGAWSAIQNDGSLTVSAAAALNGTAYGLAADMNDLSTIWVQDDSPTQEPRYRSRFYLNTNSFDTGFASGINRTILFIAVDQNPTPEPGLPTRRLFLESIRYRPDEIGTFGTAYGVVFWVFDPSIANYQNFGVFRFSPGTHYIETDWRAATTPGGTDGSFQVWVDGVSQGTLTGLPTYGYGGDFCRLGIIQPLAATSTTVYLDEFESRRQTYVGP